ncbi:hypothetical protein HYT92_02680 [Candidatus Pacearchaeota archaeon]|nr:hypothetical protein [Candidatus Pacearchaeota archaeon]
MVNAAHEIAYGFSRLGIYVKDEIEKQGLDATRRLAENIVVVVNRTAREHMQGAYALR